MYLHVSTLSAPAFVTQDRSTEKEQRAEIKELKGSFGYKNTYTKTHKQPARHLTPGPIFYGLNKEQNTYKDCSVSPFKGLINKI